MVGRYSLKVMVSSGNVIGMTTDILIRTYAGDFNWLDFCLRSTEKRAKGFRGVVLVTGDNDVGKLKERKDLKVVSSGPDWRDGYIQQMNDKLHADLYTDADFILHTDSDCVWTRDVRPEDFLEDGKPVWLMHPFGKEHNPWPEIVHQCLGFNSPYSFMRRHPFMLPRGIYARFRAWMEKRHGMPLDQFVIQRPWRSFIEYESLGTWAYEFARDEFVWKDQGDFPVFVNQEWSWGGLSQPIVEKLEKIIEGEE